MERPLSPADRAWLRMERPDNLMVITGVLAFDAPFDRARLRALVAERLTYFPRFRQTVVNDRWCDDLRFDLEAHLLFETLPEPADRATVRRRIGELLGQPLDPADADGVLVEQHLAAHDHLHPGDHVAVLVDGAWHPVTVRGIAASAEYIWPARSRQDVLPPPGSFGVIFSGPALAASLSPAPTEVAVRFVPDPSHAVATRVRAVADAHGAAGIMTRDEQPSNATLREDIDGFKEMALMFPGLFLLAAALATAEWVDWFNHRRLYEYCGDIPPAEMETAHYAQQPTPTLVEVSN